MIPVTTTPIDIRLRAHALGLRTRTFSAAFRLLEQGDPDAVAVFDALSQDARHPTSNTWGVRQAFASGLRGEHLSVRII